MSHFIVRCSAAKMPASCWGRYGRVAVLEVEDGIEHASMISKRAKGVIRIVETWERLNMGRTERCAFNIALAEARELAAKLNGESNQK